MEKTALKIIAGLIDPLPEWPTFMRGHPPSREPHESVFQYRDRLGRMVKEAAVEHVAALLRGELP